VAAARLAALWAMAADHVLAGFFFVASALRIKRRDRFVDLPARLCVRMTNQ
jgi:hypothetical protein